MQSWNQWGGGSGGVYNYQTAPATAASTPSTDVPNYGSNYQYYSTSGSTDASQMDMSAYNQQQQQYTMQQQQQWQQWSQWQQQFQQWQQQYGDKYQQAMGGMPVTAPPPTPSGAAYNPSVQPPLPPLPPSDKPVNPPLPSEPPLPPPQPLQPPLPPNQMPAQAPHSQPPPVPPVSQSQGSSSSVVHQQPSQPPLPPQQPQPSMPPPLLSTHHPPPPPATHMHHQGYHQGQGMYPGSNYGPPYEGQESNQGGYYPRSNTMGENYGGPNQYSVAPPYTGDEYEGGGGGGGYEGRKRPMGGGNDNSFGSQGEMGGKKMRMDMPPPSDKGSDKEHRDSWSGWGGGDEGGRGGVGGGRMEPGTNQHVEVNKPLPSLKPKDVPDEELSEAEKSFDAQFVQWESQFMRWKEQNKNHSDKNQYREYEAKWESWREQLLQRREQMKKKRENGKATSDAGSVGPRTGMSPFAKMPPLLPEKSPEAHAGDVPRSTHGGERWWTGPPPDHSREQESGMGGRYEGGGPRGGGRDGMREGGGGMLGSRGGEGTDGRFDGRWSTGGDSAGEKPAQKSMGAKEEASGEIQRKDDKDIIDMPKEEHSNDKNGDDPSGASKLGLLGAGGSGKGIPGLDLVTDPNAMNADREENDANVEEFLAKEKEESEGWHGGKEEEREEGNWFNKRGWGDSEGGNQSMGEDSKRNQGMGSQRPTSVEREGDGKNPWKTGMHRNQSGMFGPPDKPMHPGNRMHDVDEDKNMWQNQRQHTPHDMYGPPPDTHSPMPGPGGRMLEGRPPHDADMRGSEESKPWNNQQRGPQDMVGPMPDARMMSGRPVGSDMRESEGKPWQNQHMGHGDMFGPPPGMRPPGGHMMDSDMRNDSPKKWQNQPRGLLDYGPPDAYPPGRGGAIDSDMRDFNKPWGDQRGPPPRGQHDMFEQSDMRQDSGRMIDTDIREDMNKPWQNRGPPEMFGPGMRSLLGDGAQQQNMKPSNQGLSKQGPFGDNSRFQHDDMRPSLSDSKHPRGGDFDPNEPREDMYPRGRGDWDVEGGGGGFPRSHWRDDHPRNQRYDEPPREDWGDMRGPSRLPPMEDDPFDHDHRAFFDDQDQRRRDEIGMGPEKGPLRRGDHGGRPFGLENERFRMGEDDRGWEFRERRGMEQPMRPLWEPPEETGPPPRHSPPPHAVRDWEPPMAAPTVIDYGHISRVDIVPEAVIDRAPTPPRNVGGSVQTFDYGHGAARNPVPFVVECAEREQWRGNEYGDRDSRVMSMNEPPMPRAPWERSERSPPKGRNFEPPVKAVTPTPGKNPSSARRAPTPTLSTQPGKRIRPGRKEHNRRRRAVNAVRQREIAKLNNMSEITTSPVADIPPQSMSEENQRRESRWEKPRWSNTKHNEPDRWEGEERHSTGTDRWSSSQSRKDRERERDEKRGDRDRDRERERDKDRERDRDRDRGRKGRPRLDEERSGSSGGGSGSRGHDSEKDKDRERSSSSRHKKDESSSSRSNNVSGNTNSSNPSVSAPGSSGSHSVVSYPAQSTNSPPPPPVISQQAQPSLAKIETVLIEDLLAPPGRANRPPRIVIILRGPPGSGKTFVAKLVKDKEVEQGGSAPRILSLDDYFMVEFEKEEKDPETGRKVTKKFMKYEYEPEMEKQYRNSLIKALRKTVDDGYFPFIIVDCVNDKVRQFDEMWTYAKQKGFQVYICEMDMDVSNCSKRNTHGRSQRDIEDMVKHWEETPRSYVRVDVRSLLQSVAITEVEMEDSTEEKAKETKEEEKGTEEKDKEQQGDAEEDAEKIVVTSKWEGMEASEEKLDRLDGLAKKRRTENHPQSLEDWLQLPDDYEKRKCTPGKKQVRWADLEERRRQERIRAIGFVVGQTDWSRMTDPTFGEGALTQTKYI